MSEEKEILVTGANGQLGQSIRTLVPASGHFHFTDVDTLDIGDKRQLTDFVLSNHIQYILNCAAYTAVDKAEDDVAVCTRVNCDGVRNMGEVSQAHGLKIVHVSTDYVFDGKATRPYKEDDATNPTSVYGKTKLAGETALREACPGAVIIRTAWLYSEFGTNFVKTMLRLGNERDEINVVSDQLGTPTYAGDLAAAILTILNQSFVPGVYHYSDKGVCSWFDFATKIMELAGVNCRVHPVTTQDYPTRASRPAYSVLSKEKIKQVYGVEAPEWEDSLTVCLRKLLARS
ncbi:MAG: dTDP-4-dehydrorhamnose reductase [Tannerella sp.]|jgi:dTDP-4-dehydrorhamnose reductase|nr:dTDP-4-dehydrorhamnose reductase [Tannerella sp.]